MGNRTWNVLSVCSGVGGLDLGINLAHTRARTVCYVEREAYACQVLASRMAEGALAEAPVWSDARTFDGVPWRGKVDCVAGGYPCVGFSSMGQQLGHDDPRNVWPDFRRIVEECQPGFVFIENVSNHLRLGFRRVADELRGLGFHLACGLFSAAECGLPHRRERIFALAHRPGLRLEGCGPRPNREPIWEAARGGRPPDDGPPVVPPPWDDDPAWDEVCLRWPWLRPEVESDVRGVALGATPFHDRLLAAGNSVVPLVAAHAFLYLADGLGVLA